MKKSKKKFRLVLSNRGKEVYKGANVEVIDKALGTCGTDKDIEKAILKIGSEYWELFEVEEIKEGSV
jgi:hypothetical protein